MASILKRKDSYFIAVSMGYDNNGRQIRRTMTYTPDEGMTKKQIEKEVQRQAVLFEEKCKHGSVAHDNRMKFADFVPIYLDSAKLTMSESVYYRYEKMLQYSIIPELGHLKLKDIKPLHVQRYVDSLIRRNERYDGVKKPLSPSSIQRYYTVLRSVMRYAYKLDIIPTNPADKDRITLPRQIEPDTEIIKESELPALFSALSQEPLQYQVIIHLALSTGCRRGEIVGLKWSDFDFSTGYLTISRSNYKVANDSEIRSKSTKTGKTRQIIVPPYCLTMLKKLKAEQAKEILKLGDAYKNDGWVFTQADGSPMYPTTPTQWFDRFQKRHNLPHRKFHALRHTSATLLLSNGTNIKNVASRLGHSQLKTTNRYVHAVEQAERESANLLENILNKKAQHTA